MQTITKKKLVAAIHKRFGKSLRKRLIHDSVNEICQALEQALVSDQAVSVVNFGTFSPFMFHSHEGMNVSSGERQVVPSFRTIKFRAHVVFLDLLSCRRMTFQENDIPHKKKV